MKILTIAQRIITQIIRDKRTLLLLFIAPIMLLTLLHYIFQTVDEGEARVGIYHIPEELNRQLIENDIERVKISSTKNLKNTIEDKKLDGIIISNKKDIEIYYTNLDPNKNIKLKSAIQGYKIKTKFSKSQIVIDNMQQKFEDINQQMDKLKDQLKKLGPLLDRIGIDLPQTNNKDNQIVVNEDVLFKTHYIYGDKNSNYFDMINPVLIAFFIFFFTFLISGITLLKERTTGTLNKLLSTPIKRYEIVIGYMLGFSLFGTIQTVMLVLYAVYVLKMEVAGSIWLLIISNIILAFVALSLGLFISTFAKSEFQMIQFIPLIIVPQLLFSGIIPIENMHKPLQIISYIMPLKFGADNLSRIMLKGQSIEIIPNIIVLIFMFIFLMILNIALLKRYRNI
ncbi:ABC transporter permease [Macrococcus epidermidis]|uniref:ABC transporter permease n=1 Tax=Macrococcus epidermidis TaxID=1902580 RepID=UPI001475FF87|nr:ABC transporter permease [Macrococcus epidermidis]